MSTGYGFILIHASDSRFTVTVQDLYDEKKHFVHAKSKVSHGICVIMAQQDTVRFAPTKVSSSSNTVVDYEETKRKGSDVVRSCLGGPSEP